MMMGNNRAISPFSNAPDGLRARWVADEDRVWVTIAGAVNASTRFDLLQAIVGRYHRGVRQVTVDLSEVTRFDREAVGTLRTSRRVLEATGVELHLRNVPQGVRQVLGSTSEP